MTASWAIRCILLATALSACRPAPDASSSPDVPEGVRVTVEIDGREIAPITSDGLRAAPPSYQDADHRAWRLAAILPVSMLKEGMELDVEEGNGRRTIFARLGEEAGEPVLMVNRKGQVLVALVEPNNPFPAFHGRGGNRGLGGRANRVRGVVKLRLASQ